jgi:hypothetical protein
MVKEIRVAFANSHTLSHFRIGGDVSSVLDIN